MTPGDRPIETADQQIRVSGTLLEQWRTWSEPIQIRAIQYPDGEWALIMRVVSAQSPRRVFMDIMDETSERYQDTWGTDPQ